MKQRRPPKVLDDRIVIQLTRGLSATIDLEDRELSLVDWFANRFGYAYRGHRKQIYLHREVAARAGLNLLGAEIDHIDGDRTNNCRSNLRAVTHAQNCLNRKRSKNNTTGRKGISIRKGRFVARIQKNRRSYWLGHYDTLEKATAAYRAAEQRLYGEFARNELCSEAGHA